jgi:hypothetical protein
LFRKVSSILLIITLLFNLIGYRIVMEYLQHKANKELQTRLDQNQYDEAQLVELKIPLNMPYLADWESYQRYDGELQLNGVEYQYVKRKVCNDTLYLLCIPNLQKMRLEAAKNDLFKLTMDFNQNDGSRKTDNLSAVAVRGSQGDYDEYSFVLSINSRWDTRKQDWPLINNGNLISFPHLSPEQPPDSAII